MTARRWVFTINNYQNSDEINLLNLETNEKIRYLCYGREVGEQGTPHLQGYLECNDPMRLAGVSKLMPRAWIQKAFGTSEENQKYTGKDEDWICFGKPMPGRGYRSDLHEAMSLIAKKTPKKEIMEALPKVCAMYPKFIEEYTYLCEEEESREFRHVTTEVLWGDSGIGKTRKAREMFPDIFPVNPDDSFPFDKYNGQNAILIDDFYGGLKYHFLLRILDGHQLRVNTKYGCRFAKWTKVVITSNNAPGSWYEKGLTPALKRRLTTVTELRHEVAGNNVPPPAPEEITDLLREFWGPPGGQQWAGDKLTP